MTITTKVNWRILFALVLIGAFVIYLISSSQPRSINPIAPVKMADNTKVTSNIVKDLQIFYREAIPENSKVKFTVLFLHGMKFSSKNWQELGTMDLLASKGFRAVAIDLPGYGKSPSKELGESNKVDLLLNIMESLNIDKPVIVSPSMSGSYSLPLIFERADSVRGFVPIAPVGTERYNGGHYEKLEIPTLIVYGKNDNTGLGAERSKLLAEIPGSETKVIENAGHACYLDNHREFHEVFFNFLDRLPHDNVAE